MHLLRIIFCFFLLVVLIFPIAFVCLLIKIETKGPIIYWSKRIGINNKTFMMPKFRTMKVFAPQISTELMAKEQNYITRVGHYLRKMSIDEIPQIYSIIKGDMAFIGPRPALFNQEDLIELRTKMGIHRVLPGITGWAQVNGRDSNSVKIKVSHDLYYLNNQSILLNFKIIFLTILKLFNSKDISH